jgi:hypothetical protein
MRRLCGMFPLLAFALTCGATTFNCMNISVPGTPTGINNSGFIAGSTPDGHGYVRDPAGNITLVDYPGLSSTRLLTINNNGVAVGYAGFPPQTAVFTRDLSGTVTPINPAPWTNGLTSYPGSSPLYGTNDSGAISAVTGGSLFILNPDGTTIPVPAVQGAAPVMPGALNNSLLMLEGVPVAANGYPALGGPGLQPVPVSPNDPTGAAAWAFGLNNTGTSVGYIGQYVKSPPFGPPWQSLERDSSGVFSSIICNGLQNLQPYAINDNGTVTGTYMGGSTPEYFLANPVPGLAQFSDSVSSIAFGVVPWNQSGAPVPVVITNSGNAVWIWAPAGFADICRLTAVLLSPHRLV